MTTHLEHAELAAAIERLLSLRADPRAWIEENLKIRTKDRRLVPLRFNAAQRAFYERRSGRDLILKARQMGMTTEVAGLMFADTVLRPNTNSVIVAHDADSAQRIFRIVHLFWDWLPAAERALIGPPRLSNRRELVWPRLNSQFYVGTAGSLTFGRGQTIHNLHCSEFSIWPHPEEALASLTEAVPEDGRIVVESTAHGRGNHFHTIWQEARAGGPAARYTPHFHPWWHDPEYRAASPVADLTGEEAMLMAHHRLSREQIAWRREKQAQLRDRFVQEYPEDDISCFLGSGRGVFDAKTLARLASAVSAQKPPEDFGSFRRRVRRKGGQFESVNLLPARLLVWEGPEEGVRYAIGADVAEGIEGADASAAVVINRKTGRQCAELHGWIPPDRFAHALDGLGQWYNRCRIGVERNNHGHSCLNTLLNECRYPDLYHHVRYDGGNVVLGWPTDQVTKPLLVDDLAAALLSGAFIPRSADLVDELFSFVLHDNGSQGATEGHHDDRVIAAGIALQVAKRPTAIGSSQRPLGM